ncbi:MAG: hypothetical protein M3Q10_20070 [Chloroflexota bacterium]|nr:hypothetical protein [Chloroflexota bacterium]
MTTTQTKTRRSRKTTPEVVLTTTPEQIAADVDAFVAAPIAEATPTIDLPEGDDGSVGSIAETRANHTRARLARPAKTRKVEPKSCQCSCGGLTAGGDFLPGHDSKLKSRLIKAARTGDLAAKDELARHGWDYAENPVKAKLSDEQKAERARAKVEAKVERLRFQLAEAEQELAAL